MMYHVKSLVSRSKIGSSIRFLSPYRAEKLTQRLRDSRRTVNPTSWQITLDQRFFIAGYVTEVSGLGVGGEEEKTD